jgi:hypothetical protein
MMVKRQEALEQKHCKKASQQPHGAPMDGASLINSVGQQPHHGKAQHETPDKTDGQLKASMSELEEIRQCSSTQRREQREQGIKEQQRCRGMDRGVHVQKEARPPGQPQIISG